MEVKGTAVIAIREYVKKNYSGGYKKWLESLTPASQNIFADAIDSSRWYPVENGALEPTIKIGELFHEGDIKNGAWNSGIFSAEKALTGIYKIFVKASSPAFIVQRASRVFATYYQPCEINVSRSDEKSVSMELTGFKADYEVIEFRILGWIQRALEISGAQNVKIDSQFKQGEQEIKEIKIFWD